MAVVELWVLVLAVFWDSAVATPKPNLILVMCDDMDLVLGGRVDWFELRLG